MQLTSRPILTYRDGSVQPFLAVYEAIKRPLYAFCYRLAGNADDASDAVQEAFIRLLDRSGDIANEGSVKSWLYSTARNHIYNGFRRDGRLQSFDEDDLQAESTPYTDVERLDEAEFFNRLLARLTFDHREVLVLREYEGYSYEEMAVILNVPESTIKMRLFKARKLLAQKFTALNRTR
jgi:RNA polymerase sigma-70 factor (ECF subfamily)